MNLSIRTGTNMGWMRGAALLSALALSLWTGAAAAQEESDEPAPSSPLDRRADIGLAIGGKGGVGLGQPASEFGATPVFEIELQYLLPLDAPIGRSLGLFFSGQYTQPGIEGDTAGADPRLPGGGSASYELTQRHLTFSLGGVFRFDLDSDLVMPYAGLGGRMYLLRTEVAGEVDGVAFGDNEETKTGFGLLLLGGVDLYVGPGALLAELQFGWGPLDAYVLRDTNLGALGLSVGYRLIF